MLVESLDWVPAFWPIRYIMSLGVAMTLPVLLYLLSHITTTARELVVRANHLPTQDALTGLLTGGCFSNTWRVGAACHRAPRAIGTGGGGTSVNHDHIRQTFGDTTAEQCLLRAVVKVQRILRDVDQPGGWARRPIRAADGGVKTRESLTERMVQLIGSGLIRCRAWCPKSPCTSKAACVLLHERFQCHPTSCSANCTRSLADMSPHTPPDPFPGGHSQHKRRRCPRPRDRGVGPAFTAIAPCRAVPGPRFYNRGMSKPATAVFAAPVSWAHAGTVWLPNGCAWPWSPRALFTRRTWADVRAYALNAASRALLEGVRGWPRPSAATPVQVMQVQDDGGGEVVFCASKQGEALNWIVDVPALESRLADAVRFQPLIELVDTPQSAALHVICEGKASATRKNGAPGGMPLPMANRLWPAYKPRRRTQTAHQWFHQGDILALLPLGKRHRATTTPWSGRLAPGAPSPAIAVQNPIFVPLCMEASHNTWAPIADRRRKIWPLQHGLARRWSGTSAPRAVGAGR